MNTENVARSVSELLMSVESSGLATVADDLRGYLDDPLPERRALAMAVLVRSGSSLQDLAERDSAALLEAVSSMSPEQLPDNAVANLKQMVTDGTIDAATGVEEVARLSTDRDALFSWLAEMVGRARDVGFDQWGPDHTRAMAALRGMHTIDFADWPAGYADYAIEPADPEVYALGRELYHLEEKGCVKCHGEHGEGVEGYPPLADSPWVLGEPRRAAAIVAYGLRGPLTMPDGRVFGVQSSMDPVQKGSNFSDADVAAILTYVRQSWGNYASPVTFRDVQSAPPAKDRGSWLTTELLQRFPLKYDRLVAGGDTPVGPSVPHWSPPRGGLLLMLVIVLALNGLLGGATYLCNR